MHAILDCTSPKTLESMYRVEVVPNLIEDSMGSVKKKDGGIDLDINEGQSMDFNTQWSSKWKLYWENWKQKM